MIILSTLEPSTEELPSKYAVPILTRSLEVLEKPKPSLEKEENSKSAESEDADVPIDLINVTKTVRMIEKQTLLELFPCLK